MAEQTLPCSCGRLPAGGDRFCGDCGSVVAINASAALVDGVIGDASDHSVTSDSEVTSPSRRLWVLLGLGAAGLLVALAQWPGSAAVSDVEESRPAATAEELSAAFTVGSNSEGFTDVEPTGAEVDTGLPTPGASPMFGEVSGLGLITTTDSGTLRLTNLDTGEIVDYRARGEVVGVIGATAITQSSSGNLEFVDLNDPRSDGAFLLRPADGFLQLLGIHDDLVWVRAGDGSQSPVEAYDERGTKVAELALDGFGIFYYAWVGHPDLFQNAGGIYRRTGSEYQRVSSGYLLASSERLALVKNCDDQMSCETAWYSRPNWDEPIDTPVPGVNVDAQFSIMGDDRWLVQYSWQDAAIDLIEVSTGRVARSIEPPLSRFGTLSLPISPDGRWMLDRKMRSHILVDLDSGAETDFDLGDSSRTGSAVLFIDLEVIDLEALNLGAIDRG